MWIISLSAAKGLNAMYKNYIKRLLDIILCLIAMPFFLGIVIVVGPIIMINDFGPIFYNGKRVGKNGKVFKMYKFRSMKIDAPDIRNSDGSTYNSDKDERLTAVGTFIRKTSIDEIPQLINVLKGDMSIVGPRPDLPEQIKLYTEKEKRKLEVLPGITGFSQAYYRNSIPWKDRINNDIWYIDHVSLGLDIKIVIKTIASVVRSKGVYSSEEK